MKRLLVLAATATMLFATSDVAKAAAPTDCPLRDAPFSIELPLVDLLASPAAIAIAEKELGTRFDSLPPGFGTAPPTFAAIVTLKEAAAMGGKRDNEALARADAALRQLPVMAADKVARCARYDNDQPRFSLAKGSPRILLFEKINGFRDGPSVEAGRAAFFELARENGWAVAATDRGGAMNAATLRKFDVVIWNNVSGDVLTLSQRSAFRDYIESGGAFVGVHGSAGDPAYFWDWYADTLIGARFAGHPMAPQFQDARIVLESADAPLVTGLPGEWTMNDEWYSFRTNPRNAGATVIATLDESSYSPGDGERQNLRMGDHPIAWSNCIGRGRMFYSAIGHRPETYSDPRYRTLLKNAINWAAQKARCQK